MDIENIIRPKTPEELRLEQIRHSHVHKFIPDIYHSIFIHKKFEDKSCIKCEGPAPESFDKKLEPLQEWLRLGNGNIIPSHYTYEKFESTDFPTASRRRRENILQIIYTCRFVKYPETWDYTYLILDRLIKKEKSVPNQQDKYLPDLTEDELNFIHNQVENDMRETYGDEIFSTPTINKGMLEFDNSLENTKFETPSGRSNLMDKYFSATSHVIPTERKSDSDIHLTSDWQAYAADPNQGQSSATEVANTARNIQTALQPVWSTSNIDTSLYGTPMDTTGYGYSYRFPQIPYSRSASTTPVPTIRGTPMSIQYSRIDNMGTYENPKNPIEEEPVAETPTNKPFSNENIQGKSSVPIVLYTDTEGVVANAEDKDENEESEKEDVAAEYASDNGEVIKINSDTNSNENSETESETESSSEESMDNEDEEKKKSKGKGIDTDTSGDTLSPEKHTPLTGQHKNVLVTPIKYIKALTPPAISTHPSSSGNKNIASTSSKPQSKTQSKTFSQPQITIPVTSPTKIPPQSFSFKQKNQIMEAAQLEQLLNNLTTNMKKIKLQAPVIQMEQNIRPYDIQFIEGKTNPRKFLEELEKRFNANKVDEYARKIKILCSIVPTPIADWVTEWSNQTYGAAWTNEGNVDRSLCHQFTKKFITAPLKRKLRDEYNKLTLGKDQSVNDYARKLAEYWHDLQNKPGDAEKVDRFIQGLPNSMKLVIYQQGEPATIGEALERARNAELARMFETEDDKQDVHKSMLMIVEKLNEVTKAVASSSAPAKQVYVTERAPVNNQGRPPRERKNNFNNFNNNSTFQRRGNFNRLRNVQCYNCGRNGHYARDCRTPKCQNCGKVGHHAKDCSTQPTPKNC